MGGKPRARDWRWVTRDTGSAYVRMYSGARKPTRHPHGRWRIDRKYESMWAKDFESLFFAVPADRPIKVRFKAEIVE